MISNEKLLKSYSLQNCLKVYKKLNLSVAINSQSPTIGTLAKERGTEFTEAFLCAWLINLNHILGIKNQMSDEQIEFCASELINEFRTLKIADLTLVFKRIMSGKYGEFYESLSSAKVLSWFRDYFDERCDFAEQESDREHNKFKQGIGDFNQSSNIKRVLTGISERVKK